MDPKTKAEKERARRAAETPEQREARLNKRRARYASAEWLEKHRAYCKAYYVANPEKFKGYEKKKQSDQAHLDRDLIRTRKRHGIENATAERREGPCENTACVYVGALKCDHWHSGPKKGQVRGWLCNKCNMGLGNFDDDLALLAGASAYIQTRA